jgi:hypothetical protein
MKPLKKCLLPLIALCLLLSSSVMKGDSKNIADYPLRVHIFSRNETTFYHNRYADEAKGEGRANLFENGEVHGIEFTFDCDQKLKSSFGYETYPAKWKKPGQSLTVLLPVFGKANAYFTCELKSAVKDFAYVRHDDRLTSEPVDQYKQWMIKHDYDPEHGKNTPVKVDQNSPESGQVGSASQQ